MTLISLIALYGLAMFVCGAVFAIANDQKKDTWIVTTGVFFFVTALALFGSIFCLAIQ